MEENQVSCLCDVEIHFQVCFDPVHKKNTKEPLSDLLWGKRVHLRPFEASIEAPPPVACGTPLLVTACSASRRTPRLRGDEPGGAERSGGPGVLRMSGVCEGGYCKGSNTPWAGHVGILHAQPRPLFLLWGRTVRCIRSCATLCVGCEGGCLFWGECIVCVCFLLLVRDGVFDGFLRGMRGHSPQL